ncbi:MAG: BON domain-containing protein [Planctomycetes bacterium]|nr:BON domain-containing protein [Planctomycetota bacterium]
MTIVSDASTHVAPAVDQQLIDRATTAIVNNPHLPKRKVRLEARQGQITLKGVVNSFFQKQMAQEALRRIEGVRQIDNELEVQWS